MKFIRLLMAITFMFAFIFCIGTADAWGYGQITATRAFVQWGVSLAIMWGIVKAGRAV